MKIVFLGARVPKELKEEIKRAAATCFDVLGQDSKPLEVNIKFVSEAEIRRLNGGLRKVDRVTDVLSFPAFSLDAGQKVDTKDKSLYFGKTIFLGDMAICLPQTERQAAENNVTMESEVIKLVIHSLLHLMGYDHIKDEDYAVMNQKEEQIASKFYAN